MSIDAISVLCAQLMRDLFAIAKFLFTVMIVTVVKTVIQLVSFVE